MSTPAESAEEMEKPYLKKDGEFFCAVTALEYGSPQAAASQPGSAGAPGQIQTVSFIAHKKPHPGPGDPKYCLVDTEKEYPIELGKVGEANESGDWGVTARIYL